MAFKINHLGSRIFLFRFAFVAHRDLAIYIGICGNSGNKTLEAALRLGFSVPTGLKTVGTGGVLWEHFQAVPTEWANVPTKFRAVGTLKALWRLAYRDLFPLFPQLLIYKARTYAMMVRLGIMVASIGALPCRGERHESE